MIICVKDEIKWLQDHSFIWQYNYRRDGEHIHYSFLILVNHNVFVTMYGNDIWYCVTDRRGSDKSHFVFESICLKECLSFIQDNSNIFVMYY